MQSAMKSLQPFRSKARRVLAAGSAIAHFMLALAVSESGARAQTLEEPETPLPQFSQLPQLPQPVNPTGCAIIADAQVPLVESHGRFVSPVVIDEQPLLMLVDTGASGTALSPRMAAALHLNQDPDRRVRVTGVGGQLDSQHPLMLHSIHFGSINLENYDVLTASIVRPEQENDASSAVGLIGADMLSRFDVELDFPNHRMTLYRVSFCSGRFVPWSGAYNVFMASRTSKNGFIIPIALNGVPIRALIDTGSNISSLSREGALSVGVDNQGLDRDQPGDFVGSKGTAVSAHKHEFGTMTVGASTFRNVKLFVQDGSFPGTDMLLGMDFLRWRKLWISYSTNQIFIQYNPRERLPQ